MNKVSKKITSLLICTLMVLSCLNVTFFTEIGSLITSAANVSIEAGDINGDGTVNNKDLTRLLKHIAGEDVEVVAQTLDTNGDGTINNKDLTRLLKYIAGEDVELAPVGCDHSMTVTEFKEATCTTAGNIAYWYCSVCGGYFSDAEGLTEISLEDTVLEALGHTPVVDPAVAPTYESTGLTAGSHCSACNTVLQAQEEVPMLQKTEYAITYDLYNGDTYLQSIGVTNNNPSVYASEDGLQLKNLKATGYKFLGWYDLPAGSNAEIVKSIPAGTKGEIELYAHWEKEVYEVKFESDLKPIVDTTYTVDQGLVLPVPQLDGYIFAGWSDEEGEVLKKIPIGTTGPKTYKANWLSERNQAWTKKVLDDPIIYEDDNVILFTYEIGEIRNVPLYVIHDFGKINSNGVEKTITKTHSTTISETEMYSYANTVSKATTDSFGWSLSNEWSESVSINEEWAHENGLTKEEAEEICTNESNNWYVSSGSSGTHTDVELSSTDEYDLTTTTKNEKTYNTKDEEKRQDFSAELGVDVNYHVGLGKVKSFDVGGGLDLKYENGRTTTTKTGKDTDEGSTNQDGSITHKSNTSTDSSSWNKESGYGGSSSVSKSSSIITAISESISNKYGYGKNYINSENQSSTLGITSSNSDTEEYSSTVTYSKINEESITATYTTSNTMSGYHRWIMAGTAHVFAIVGYDIAKQSYFVTNFSVMDDEMHEFEDYSYSYSSYDDNQNGVIEFEVPNDVLSYVMDRTAFSSGLEVSKAGVVTGYTGDETFVVVPEYKVIENADGTSNAIKITGFDKNAFAGNNKIECVLMSDFVTEVPCEAFSGCTELVSFDGKGITSIGDRAFENCPNLKVCNMDDNITSLGTKAFDGIQNYKVMAANSDIVSAAVQSGAKEITIGISEKCTNLANETLIVDENTDVFTFNGYAQSFENVYIISDAAKTNIHRANFISDGKTPLQISSPEIQLQEVTVNAPAIGLICYSPTTDIKLYGESYFNSKNENAVLCKNITLEKIKDDYFSQMHVSGNVLLCGKIENDDYLSVKNGYCVYIDEEMFDKYKQGTINVSFNSNGGSVSDTTKTVYYGQLYGDLPVPTREHYSFLGWYTEAEEGTEVTAETTVTSLVNQTLYAHWSRNTYKVNFNANGGSVSTASKNVESGTKYGTLPTPTWTGRTFKGWFTAVSGGSQVTADTTVALSGEQTLYARWQVNSYTASWSTGTGYSITVKRTSSPNAGASIANISSGSTVYYGDVLSITYSASTGYSITGKGSTSITVSGNVASSNIWASASANNYTYTILYRSTNGTDLGSSSATHPYNSGPYTISAPGKTGYATPGSQSVKWDSTSKTITFYYTPNAVASEHTVKSGSWWKKSNYTYIDYTTYVELQNRNSNSIQVRIRWTNTFTRTDGKYGYAQYFNASIGGVPTGDRQIASSSTWNTTSSGTDKSRGYSEWLTIPVSPTQTSISMSANWWDQNSKSGSWSATFSIPAY